MDTTSREHRCEVWLELLIEDSFNAEMSETDFAACCEDLIIHLNAHIRAAKPLVTPEEIVREIRNDDMAAWLGVNRKDLQSR